MLDVSGLWSAAVAGSPLRSRSADSRSTLRSRSSVFWNVRSPLRSRSLDFLPAPLRFPCTPLSAHMLCRKCVNGIWNEGFLISWPGSDQTAIGSAEIYLYALHLRFWRWKQHCRNHIVWVCTAVVRPTASERSLLSAIVVVVMTVHLRSASCRFNSITLGRRVFKWSTQISVPLSPSSIIWYRPRATMFCGWGGNRGNHHHHHHHHHHFICIRPAVHKHR